MKIKNYGINRQYFVFIWDESDNINWIFNFKYQKLKMTCLLKITAYNLVPDSERD